MKRILHIGLSCLGGGLETCAMNYFRALSGSDIVFDFADIYGDGLAYDQEITALGGRIYSVGNYKVDALGVYRNLVSLMKEGNHDAAHIHMLSAANLVPVLAARSAGIPVILHCHNTNCPGIIRKVMNILGGVILRRIPATRLACSEPAKAWMWKNKKAEVLPNAMDLKRFAFSEAARNELRRDWNIGEKTLVLGFLGRIEHVKNVLWLPDILDGVRKYIPDVKLLVVGTGSAEQELRHKIHQMQLEEYVIFAGFQQNTPDWYSVMDVFLLPSKFEGLPLTCVEAQASGMPCLLSAGIASETKQTESVWFLDTREANLQEWVDTVIQIAENKTDRTSVQGMKGSVFDMESAVERLRKIYGMDIAGRRYESTDHQP